MPLRAYHPQVFQPAAGSYLTPVSVRQARFWPDAPIERAQFWQVANVQADETGRSFRQLLGTTAEQTLIPPGIFGGEYTCAWAN